MTPIESVNARAYTIPTDKPEADGTLRWDRTTIVVVTASGGGMCGLGYSYTDASVVALIHDKLRAVVTDIDAMNPAVAWQAMRVAIRNMGHSGLAATAISAIDLALYDLKAKLVELPLSTMLGRYRDSIKIYGSGGFTTYDDHELTEQLARWVDRDGCAWVKMKVGSNPKDDARRAAVAKAAIGDAALFVDANGAYTAKQALSMAEAFARHDVRWFEEPVSSDDLCGLAIVRERAPPGMDIAAGEYGYTTPYFNRMLAAGAVDVQQADITRCTGVTGFLQVAALCEAHQIDLSAHCAPAAHLHAASASPRLRHQEWFHDHVRIEQMLFDGAPVPRNGMISPDLTRSGLGLDLKSKDAERYAV